MTENFQFLQIEENKHAFINIFQYPTVSRIRVWEITQTWYSEDCQVTKF